MKPTPNSEVVVTLAVTSGSEGCSNAVGGNGVGSERRVTCGGHSIVIVSKGT